MKMTLEKTDSILAEAIDLSGSYHHLVEISLSEDLMEQLKYGKLLLVASERYCTLNFYTDCYMLYKLYDRKEEAFPGWEEMLKTQRFCYLIESSQKEEILGDALSDTWHAEMRINTEARFSLLITCILDEDGGLIQYETPWLDINNFID